MEDSMFEEGIYLTKEDCVRWREALELGYISVETQIVMSCLAMHTQIPTPEEQRSIAARVSKIAAREPAPGVETTVNVSTQAA